jgi:hypothetical protein
MPIIRLSHAVEVTLTAWVLATGSKEFSGFGLIEQEGDIFHVVDVFLMGVGSEEFTEFNHERQHQLVMALGGDPRLKLWFHRHPIGSGNPGERGNWSGTDEHTAKKEPMGVDPKLVQWSVAIVRTPGGWVGRVDLHVPKARTFHCAVEPRMPSAEILEEAKQLLTPQLNEYIQVLLAEYAALRPTYVRKATYYSTYEFPDQHDYSDWITDPRDFQATDFYCDEMECVNDGVPLIEIEIEWASSASIEITTFECPKCGKMFYTQRSEDAFEIRLDQPRKQSAQRPSRDWRRGWEKVFGNKRR